MGKGNISLKVFLLKMENKMQDTILSAEASTPPPSNPVATYLKTSS